MIGWGKRVLGATMALVSASASAIDRDAPRRSHWTGSEVAVGVLEHGSNFHPLGEQLMFDLPKLPPGQFYDGSEEDGTVDVQLAYRTAPLGFALKPRLAAKAQITPQAERAFSAWVRSGDSTCCATGSTASLASGSPFRTGIASPLTRSRPVCRVMRFCGDMISIDGAPPSDRRCCSTPTLRLAFALIIDGLSRRYGSTTATGSCFRIGTPESTISAYAW